MYQPTGPAPAAAALAALLAACPPAAAFTWTVHPAGNLRGEHIAERPVSGELAALAACVGGTPFHTVLSRDDDRRELAQLVTVWQGVPVVAWTSCPVGPDRLPLGAVAVLTTRGRAAA